MRGHVTPCHRLIYIWRAKLAQISIILLSQVRMSAKTVKSSEDLVRVTLKNVIVYGIRPL